jgi:tRNA pseudouridine55 synthase
VKVRGQRAYRRARRGEEFEVPERIVTVHRFEQLWRSTAGEQPPRAGFAIESGSGTYVRSLIGELGDAYCLELRRTGIGPFDVEDAAPPPARGADWPEPPLMELERALELARSPTVAGEAAPRGRARRE